LWIFGLTNIVDVGSLADVNLTNERFCSNTIDVRFWPKAVIEIPEFVAKKRPLCPRKRPFVYHW
jgi:hypothetical protein